MGWTPLHVEWTRRAERDLRALALDETQRIIDAVRPLDRARQTRSILLR